MKFFKYRNKDGTLHIVDILNEHKKRTFLRTFNSKGSNSVDLTHCAMGLSAESGEIVDIIKKKVFYGNEHVGDEEFHSIKFSDSEKDKIKNEIGDTLYYLQGIAFLLGVSLDECMQANIDKLYERFPDKFSREQAEAKGELK